jgi:phosphoglycerate dehydrogenase-like enzyme
LNCELISLDFSEVSFIEHQNEEVFKPVPEILVIGLISDEELERIASTDKGLEVVDARGLFDSEIRETWPHWSVQAFLGNRPDRPSTRQGRDQILSKAEIILGGYPFPLTVRSRAPRLRWYHQLPAGASNLRQSDLWGSDVIVTTSRGYGNTRAMAEYVLAGFLHFARGLHQAYREQRLQHLDRSAYHPVLLQGKTAGVIGAGGIGQEVARLCARVGMRVIGTRRRKPSGSALPPGFDRLSGSDGLHDVLAESHFVAVCCQWTPETTKLIGREAFAVMRPGTVLVNVARGEVIDEEALLNALATGKLRGVILDVYVGEFEHEPDRRLWNDERVLITPHISSGTDKSQHRGVELFCENLRAYLDGRPLSNVVDWKRGY